MGPREEDNLGEISEEEDTSEEVKRVREVMGDASEEDIISIINRIKTKENENSTIGLISKSTDFRKAKREKLLMDSGASVCIMGEEMALQKSVLFEINPIV